MPRVTLEDEHLACDLSYTSWGSSSGSGAGAAANLCAAAVGTETDGSITGPSAVENIFGLKPTLGLISQDGIIPISQVQIAQYLQTLSHTNMRTLADLIVFNNAHCPQELVYYGQEIFELAQMTSGDLSDPSYVAARTHAASAARAGIDDAMTRDHLDAIVAPHLTNSTGPAVAGYPNFSMPVGIRSSGRPAGMLMYSAFLHEPQSLGFAAKYLDPSGISHAKS